MKSRRIATVLFWVLTLGLVVPVWAFPFIPTQDGPSHVANARILMRLALDDPLYSSVFAVREEPLPNWMTETILGVLLLVLPAGIAEKLLVTGYLVGFCWTFRRLALTIGPDALVVPLLGALFCYCRCFWMGFYNNCLGMVLLLGMLAVLMSRRSLPWPETGLLSIFGILAYFTHLLPYIIMIPASLAVVLFHYRRPLVSLGRCLLAWLPSAILAWGYFARSRVTQSQGTRGWWLDTKDWLFSDKALDKIEEMGLALDTQTFGPLAVEPAPMGWCLLGLLIAFFFVSLAHMVLAEPEVAEADADADEGGRGTRWPLALLLVLVTNGYFFGPEHLGFEQGGYFKQRFAVLMGVFAVLLFGELRVAVVRWGLLAGFLVVYGMLTANVWRYVARQNETLREFAAGREALGTGRIYFTMQRGGSAGDTSNPLVHAGDLYAYEADNVNVDNYQAVTKHFPVRFVKGWERGLGHFASYPRRDAVDAVVVWGMTDPSAQPAFQPFELAFAQGRLRIFVRKAPHGK